GDHRRLPRRGALGARADPTGDAADRAHAAVRQARPGPGRRGAGQAGARVTAGASARPVPPPEPLPAAALDSHTHPDPIARPVPEVRADGGGARITGVVTIGVDVAPSRWAADCAAAHPGVYAAVAVHPNETARAAGGGPADRDAVLAEIASLAALPRVRAVGETGLDYYRDWAATGVQRDWFR